MKKNADAWIKTIVMFLIIMCIGLSPFETMNVNASPFRTYNANTDVDYTGGEGASVVLTHASEKDPIATYDVTDARLNRNAAYYMSMKVKFNKSHGWVIRLRNATAKIEGETVTGNMQLHMFDNKGTIQLAGKDIGAKSWFGYTDIQDKEWHTVVVRSAVDSFEVWIDGKRATSIYLNKNVTDLTSNYTCPAITMSGYNDGTIKDICIWNNGTDENPAMPADRVVQSIESLPDTVALNSSAYSRVQQAEKDYQALSKAEKAYVRNYDKLEQLLKSQGSKENSLYVEVSGSKSGPFSEVFPNGVISHRKEKSEKYLFETKTGRKSTYYIQFVINMTSDSNCFDVILRNQEHTIGGKKVSGTIVLRMFKNSAIVLDSRDSHMSDWVNYKTNIFEGSHVITIESSPTSCTMWIDEVKYEIPHYQKPISGTADFIQATSGFSLGTSVEGTISNVRVWTKKNSYVVGDSVRVAIFNLPQLNQVTLAHAKEIQRIRNDYDALSKEHKKYVTNIAKLESLERAIAFLEEKGDEAYMFLKDEMPEVKKDYVNLISTGTLTIPATHNSNVDYNAVKHAITYKNASEYINTPFKNIQGIGSDDTYLIKFYYAPHEYYYETPSAGWMGLRVIFAGYQVGGNGAKTTNKTQFAFMTTQSAKLTWANGNSAPTDYLTSFAVPIGGKYQVTMLCAQGKMKMWVDGEPVVYYDEIPEYPFMLEFESSRVRCDVTDIQVYNLSNPTEQKFSEVKADSFKFIQDTLYDVEGISAKDRVDEKKDAFVLAVVLFVVMIAIVVVVMIVNFKGKKKSGMKKGKEAIPNDKEESN